jgi:muconate cycloisomerase
VYKNFMLQVPNKPGLGVDIDREKLQFMRRK